MNTRTWPYSTVLTARVIEASPKLVIAVAGGEPNQFQAVCWVTWKRMHNE